MQGKRHRNLNVKRTATRIAGDTARVITRPHIPDNAHRISRIIDRVLNLSRFAAEDLLSQVLIDFSSRHEDVGHVFARHLLDVQDYVPPDAVLTETQKALIGAYFTMEYAIESAALFNPSIVPHPDQSHLKKGNLRFIMSLRATGEGHVSSIVFRSGVLDRHNKFVFDPISDFVETPDLQLDPVYKRNVFQRKLNEMGAIREITTHILNQVPADFTYNELLERIAGLRAKPLFTRRPPEQNVRGGVLACGFKL